MKTIQDQKLLLEYIDQHHIHRFFPEKYFKYLLLQEYTSGEYICRQGENLQNLYFFVTGKIKIYRTQNSGKNHVLNIREQSCILGEIEFMADQPIVSSVVALKNSQVIVLPVTRLRNQLIQDPVFLYNIGNWIARELYQADIDRLSNVLCSVKEQMALYLLSEPADETFSLEPGILAESFGVSYRHILRVLNQFITEGILERQNRRYRIINREKLTNIAVPELE